MEIYNGQVLIRGVMDGNVKCDKHEMTFMDCTRTKILLDRDVVAQIVEAAFRWTIENNGPFVPTLDEVLAKWGVIR